MNKKEFVVSSPGNAHTQTLPLCLINSRWQQDGKKERENYRAFLYLSQFLTLQVRKVKDNCGQCFYSLLEQTISIS